MNPYLKRKLIILAGAVLLIVCLALVIHGQRTVGWPHILEMVIGLAGILALLYLYNRQFADRKKKTPREKTEDGKK